MKYLLDSNTIIALVMNNNEGVVRRAGECDEGDLVTSTIAYAEVAYGSVRERPPALGQLQAFADEVPILDFDLNAAIAYASLPFRRASYDRLIAAHALSRGLTMVTQNVADFSDISNLTVENWFS